MISSLQKYDITSKYGYIPAYEKGFNMEKIHWFSEECKENPENCKHSRSGKCINPVSDCLKFEDARDDYRNDKEAKRERE